MVAISSLASAGADTRSVLDALADQADDAADVPDFVYVFYGCDHNDHIIHTFLTDRFPGAAFLGGTSCAGAMNERRLWGPDSIGMLLIGDPAGDYGVAAARIGDDPAAIAFGR